MALMTPIRMFILSVLTISAIAALGDIERVAYLVDNNDVRIALYRQGDSNDSTDNPQIFKIKNADPSFLAIEANKSEQIIGFSYDKLRYEKFRHNGSGQFDYVREISNDSFDYSNLAINSVELETDSLINSSDMDGEPHITVYLTDEIDHDLQHNVITEELYETVNEAPIRANIDDGTGGQLIVMEQEIQNINLEETVDQETEKQVQLSIDDSGNEQLLATKHELNTTDRTGMISAQDTKFAAYQDDETQRTSLLNHEQSLKQHEETSNESFASVYSDKDKTIEEQKDITVNKKSSVDEEVTVIQNDVADINEEDQKDTSQDLHVLVHRVTIEDEDTLIHKKVAVRDNAEQTLI